MGLLNRTLHLFSKPYEAFYDAMIHERFGDALYYISKMSQADVNRPVSDFVADKVKTPEDYKGYSPLMLVAKCAMKWGKRRTGNQMLQKLLERGADLYYINNEALNRDQFSSRTNFFEVLVGFPKKISETKSLYVDPLKDIIPSVSNGTMKILQPYLDVNRVISPTGQNILIRAMINGYLEEMMSVLTPEQTKEGLLHCDKFGASLLTIMGYHGHYYHDGYLGLIVQKAAELGMDLNTPDKNGETIASATVINGEKSFAFLVQNGLNINAPAYQGETLLMKVIRDKQLLTFPVVRMILDHSDVNVRTERGGPSALCLAASRSEYGMIKALFMRDAKILPQDAPIIIIGLLKNERLDSVEKVKLLREAQNQIPADEFKQLLEKGLRDVHRDENDAPLSHDVSLIRAAVEEHDYDTGLLLMDNDFYPWDEKGRASESAKITHPEFKELLHLYEDVFKEGLAIATETDEEMADFEKAFFLRKDRFLQIDLLGILGEIAISLNDKDKENLMDLNPKEKVSLPGQYSIKRFQYDLNQIMCEHQQYIRE